MYVSGFGSFLAWIFHLYHLERRAAELVAVLSIRLEDLAISDMPRLELNEKNYWRVFLDDEGQRTKPELTYQDFLDFKLYLSNCSDAVQKMGQR
jgi:hypothetical protein